MLKFFSFQWPSKKTVYIEASLGKPPSVSCSEGHSRDHSQGCCQEKLRWESQCLYTVDELLCGCGGSGHCMRALRCVGNVYPVPPIPFPCLCRHKCVRPIDGVVWNRCKIECTARVYEEISSFSDTNWRILMGLLKNPCVYGDPSDVLCNIQFKALLSSTSTQEPTWMQQRCAEIV